jgi:putative peptidoglycan lipid II flippase
MIAGSLLVCTSEPIDQIMAAMFANGSLAALNYGNRVTASPISLISIALSTAILPYLSKMIACQDWLAVRRTLKKYLRLIFLTTIPLTVMLVVFSEPIVKVLFQRGLFTYQDTQIVAQLQSFYALQIPFYIGNILLIKMLISMQDKFILMSISGLNVIMNIIFNYLFVQWLGIKGIALSTSVVYLFSFLYANFWTNKLIEKRCKLQAHHKNI